VGTQAGPLPAGRGFEDRRIKAGIEAAELLQNRDVALITGTWSRIEVSGGLVRAARSGRGDEQGLLALLDANLGADGPATMVSGGQQEVEARALRLVHEHGIRATDAWHLATAVLMLAVLAEPGEERGFASRDKAQSEVAQLLGLTLK
jgi:uncharacterized protein